MNRVKPMVLTLVALSSVALLVAFGARPASTQPGDTWSVSLGDPARTGTHTTTVTISYLDANQVKKEKAITSSVSLGPEDSADTKKTKVQNALNSALGNPANQPTGAPLASTSGNGNVMTVDPASGAKIESIETTDNETGEDDKITKPGKKGLAQVRPEGELLGVTSDGGPSVFFITTNLGQASVQLSPGMRKTHVLNTLKAQLLALDPDALVWVDTNKGALYVFLPEGEEGIWQIGAGATDAGLDAACKVMVTE
jgi:hypothetical protein